MLNICYEVEHECVKNVLGGEYKGEVKTTKLVKVEIGIRTCFFSAVMQRILYFCKLLINKIDECNKTLLNTSIVNKEYGKKE